ncbi:TPA: helix-turn-helix domain-containing protein [Enterobacter hormaechei subsp. steigerwaltii]|nr:helix-turn-helix domain-containing protein [Enterobacter hormaechei subsp. steigerwaltii]
MISSLLSERVLIQHNAATSDILFKNIKFYFCSFVYIDSGMVTLSGGGVEEVDFDGGRIFFIEKNTTLSLTIKNKKLIKHYMVHNINNEELASLYEMVGALPTEEQSSLLSRMSLYHIQADKLDFKLFQKLTTETVKEEKLAIMLYFISKFRKIPQLYSTIARSITISFSETVRQLIEKDVSRNWNLELIACKLSMSTSNVRRKLYSESIKFNELLLDVRMRHALRLILTMNPHVNTLAYNLGFSNVSYFISLFKKHYGITPKQLSVQIKNTT